jgi:hypothetical protein
MPYYAGFSSAFVRDMLSYMGVTTDAVILDPMNGSGTTTLVGQQNSVCAIGADINPASAVIARAKNRLVAQHARHIRDWLGELPGALVRADENAACERTSDWISPSTLRFLHRVCRLAEGMPPWTEEPSPLIGEPVRSLTSSEGPKDFIIAAALVTARKYSRAKNSKNPTWLTKAAAVAGDPSPTTEELLLSFRLICEQMLTDLEAAYSGVPDATHRSSVVLEADARALPLEDSCIDAVITSPPYLTRIDYAVSTAPELAFLGYESEEAFFAMRANIMGATTISQGSHKVDSVWGSRTLAAIDGVRKHPSKASATYYYKTHVQYFRDAWAIVSEIMRVLKPGGSAAFVVQESWYKDVHMPLGEIYQEMTQLLGARSEILIDERVKSHLGLVNAGARNYAKGAISEQVVLATKV